MSEAKECKDCKDSNDCKNGVCKCCPWCCDKCKHKKCEGPCKKLLEDSNTCIRFNCPKCSSGKSNKCDCSCCQNAPTSRRYIAGFFVILLIFVVIGVIIYVGTVHQIPKLRSIRDYWNGKISSTSS